MSRFLVAWKLLLMSSLLAAAATAAEPQAAVATGMCSTGSLHGTCGFGFTGTRSGVPFSSSGMDSYDGHGHVMYIQLWNESGVTTTYRGTATYTISAGCIASVVYDSNTTLPAYTYFVSADGSGFYWNNNENTGIVSAGRKDRVSLTQLVK